MSSKELSTHEIVYELNSFSDKFKMFLDRLDRDYVKQSVFNPDVARMSYLVGQKELIEGFLYMANHEPTKDEGVLDDDEWN